MRNILDISVTYRKDRRLFCRKRSLGILHLEAVNVEAVAETAFSKTGAYTFPNSVGSFFENNRFVPRQVTGYVHLTSLRCIDLEQNVAVRQYARALKRIVGSRLPEPALGSCGNAYCQKRKY